MKRFVVISGPTASDWREVEGPKSKKDSLSFLQDHVGGLIERVPVRARATVWVNEEGKLDGLPTYALWLDERSRIIDGLAGNVVIEFNTDESLERVKEFIVPVRREPAFEMVSK